MSNAIDLNKPNINEIIQKVIKLNIPVLLVPINCRNNNDFDNYRDKYSTKPKISSKSSKKNKCYYHAHSDDSYSSDSDEYHNMYMGKNNIKTKSKSTDKSHLNKYRDRYCHSSSSSDSDEWYDYPRYWR